MLSTTFVNYESCYDADALLLSALSACNHILHSGAVPSWFGCSIISNVGEINCYSEDCRATAPSHQHESVDVLQVST